MGDKVEATFHGGETKLEVEAKDIDARTLGLLFGAKVPHYQGPEHSVLITYTDTVSGRPERPTLRRAPWWNRAAKRANAEAARRWMWEMTKWEMSGRPDVEVERRIFIPRAQVTPRG